MRDKTEKICPSQIRAQWSQDGRARLPDKLLSTTPQHSKLSTPCRDVNGMQTVSVQKQPDLVCENAVVPSRTRRIKTQEPDMSCSEAYGLLERRSTLVKNDNILHLAARSCLAPRPGCLVVACQTVLCRHGLLRNGGLQASSRRGFGGRITPRTAAWNSKSATQLSEHDRCTAPDPPGLASTAQ